MAEEKKEKKEKKESSSHSSGSGGSSFDDILFWLLLGIMVLWGIQLGFNYVLSALHISFSLPSFTDLIAWVLNTFQVYSIFFSLVFFIGIIYCNFKLGELASHGHGHGGDAHGHDDHSGSHSAATFTHQPDKRWVDITQKIASSNEADWRLAILEADIILEDMLGRMGYHGEGIAEKLKQVEQSDFKTVQSAWEAHKIRNQIAHGGSSYHLSRSEAERAIGLFKKVFEEFYFI